jgi:hypothetical protein
MRHKGQAALEFLTTYGWALLVVAVIISALAYFGVFDIEKMLPQKCFLSPDMRCSAYAVDSNGVSLYVVNGLGYDIKITQIDVEGIGDSLDCHMGGGMTGITFDPALESGRFRDSAAKRVRIPCVPALPRGDTLVGYLIVKYEIDTVSGYTSYPREYTIKGSLRAAVS